MKKILQKKEKVLRSKTKEVPIQDITKPKIKKILGEMFEALGGESDGVALAAPQIGYSLQIFVVAPQVFEKPEKNHLVFINPKITKTSKDKKKMEEGCLSCRWLIGKIKRSTRVTIEAYDENGEKFTITANKLLAQIFQHETDHLEGILFIDNAEDLRELKPEKNE